MQEFARAKVNLFLHVTGRRPDGYHLLDSLAVFPDCGDRLDAEPAAELTLRIGGPFGAGLDAGADNLVLRAARALRTETGTRTGAALSLTKNLPVASGIGGGSADAAAALRLLCRVWALDPGPGVLDRLAAGLGADVPVCLPSRPARMRGIGEKLSPAPALPPELGMVLVNPGNAVSTPAVFRARAPGFTPEAVLPAAWPDAGAMVRDLRRLSNDLEPPARTLCPAIDPVLGWLGDAPGALLARMSGSGATCFALFASAAEASRAAGAAPAGWWAWGGGLPSAPTAP